MVSESLLVKTLMTIHDDRTLTLTNRLEQSKGEDPSEALSQIHKVLHRRCHQTKHTEEVKSDTQEANYKSTEK